MFAIVHFEYVTAYRLTDYKIVLSVSITSICFAPKSNC